MIEIRNFCQKNVNQNWLKKIASAVLKREKEKNLELSIVLVGQSKIKKLNKQYRRRNRPTDVLSFSYNGSGEVVICLEQVKKNAKKFKSSFKTELKRVLIHGILHLLGYDHEKSINEAKRMRKKEEIYLSSII
ncbi:MAG: rRNA maturation RNase YbeY [Minisyncoccales bacterium]